MSENPVLPDQTLQNTRGLFRNYLTDYRETDTDKDERKNLNIDAYDKWKGYADLERKKVATGYYAPKKYSRSYRLKSKPSEQVGHASLPEKSVKKTIPIPAHEVNKMSSSLIRMEEGAKISLMNNPSLSRTRLKPTDSSGFHGIIMPLLEPFFHDPNSFKKLNLSKFPPTRSTDQNSAQVTSRGWRSARGTTSVSQVSLS